MYKKYKFSNQAARKYLYRNWTAQLVISAIIIFILFAGSIYIEPIRQLINDNQNMLIMFSILSSPAVLAFVDCFLFLDYAKEYIEVNDEKVIHSAINDVGARYSYTISNITKVVDNKKKVQIWGSFSNPFLCEFVEIYKVFEDMDELIEILKSRIIDEEKEDIIGWSHQAKVY